MKTAFRGLFRFLRFIDRMRERGDDLGTAKSLSEKENVVRLMTVHKSKGLEFPVVFFAGTGRPFNEMDFHKPYLFDQQYGLAVKAVNPETRIEYTSLPYLAVKEMKQLQMKAEEMRVLYVAMTRAKEKLYLTASIKDLDRLLEKWKTASGDLLLPDFKRSRAKSYLDWIGPAVSRHPDAQELHAGGEVLEHHSRFQIDIVETVSLEEPQLLLEAQHDRPEAEADAALIHSRFDFTYPHQAAVEKRSKQSVTEMKRLQLLQRSDEPESFIQDYQPKAQKKAPHRPDFLMDRKLSAADIGTAVHTVMQHLPLERKMNVGEIGQFLEELTGREILTKEEAQAVKAEQLEAFFHSTIAQRLMNAEDIRREVPFTYARPDADGDHQIVQGIVDCLFKEDGEWVLLDYKTDQTRGMSNVQSAMKERYSIQLSVYQEAVEAILRIPIKQRVLYLFATNEEVEV